MEKYEEFTPLFKPDEYSGDEQLILKPFFTNTDRSVYVPLIISPELIGALCSRTSRASQDLRYIFLNEFVKPFIDPVKSPNESKESWKEKVEHGKRLKDFIVFLQDHSLLDIFSNPKARSFYVKWLAQYGDDSIAQMAGSHLIFGSLSQVAIKHFEDQRISLAPIEKSTRYVNYSQKINGRYLYYIDPGLKILGLEKEYVMTMDNLFETYKFLMPKLGCWLKNKFPEEKDSVIEKKVFDTLRGLLPTSVLSQVSFFGNGQAFEYMISRSAKHDLGEIRWGASRALEELYKVTPSFLRRLKEESKKELIEEYQGILSGRKKRIQKFIVEDFRTLLAQPGCKPEVRVIDFDPDGENKIITAMLYSGSHFNWQQLIGRVRELSNTRKAEIIKEYLGNRTARWQKVGRALENTYVRFEIMMNIGAWRDLHRHRMLTQQRQNFSCHHGYDIPPEIQEAGLENEFCKAIGRVNGLFGKTENHNPELAQYAATLAHRVRFMQWENLRECFWEMELRTIPEGHPDYRYIEQEKYRLLKEVYPIIADFMFVNMSQYDFARRGQEEKIIKKLDKLS